MHKQDQQSLQSRDSSVGRVQTEDLKVPGSIPGLGIFNPICLIAFENQVTLAFVG
jgi:hypothetical protein